MSVSAGLPQLPRQLLRALSQNLSDSREATRSLYYYFGLELYVEHAASNAFAASGRRSGTTSGRSRSAEESRSDVANDSVQVSLPEVRIQKRLPR